MQPAGPKSYVLIVFSRATPGRDGLPGPMPESARKRFPLAGGPGVIYHRMPAHGCLSANSGLATGRPPRGSMANWGGVDGCREGWVLAVVDAAGRIITLRVLRTFAEAALETQNVNLTLADIPMGLPSGEFPERASVRRHGSKRARPPRLHRVSRARTRGCMGRELRRSLPAQREDPRAQTQQAILGNMPEDSRGGRGAANRAKAAR